VLDGAGDAAGNIEFGGDGLAGGPDLVVVGHPFGIHNRPAGTQFAAECLCQGSNNRDVVLFADTATGADYHFSLGQVNALFFGRFIADELQSAGGVCGQFGYLGAAPGCTP